MGISRRTFLIGAAGGAAVLSGIGGQRIVSWSRHRHADLWADQVSSSGGAYDLGVEYLARFPGEADRALLIASLTELVGTSASLLGQERATEGFHDHVRRDYEAGDIVDMGGWVISRTELRLCALGTIDRDAPSGVRGFFTPKPLDDGTTVWWTTPFASCRVPSNLSRLEFQLRSGAHEPQHAAIRLDGQLADEITLTDQAWRPCRYLMRASESPFVTLELSTSPAWRPSNDFRTIGAGIDRVIWRLSFSENA